jgi:hypothetical protein
MGGVKNMKTFVGDVRRKLGYANNAQDCYPREGPKRGKWSMPFEFRSDLR